MKLKLLLVFPRVILALVVIGCGKKNGPSPPSNNATDSGATPETQNTDGPTLTTGALFMCGACKCDGRVAYCQKVITGPFVPGQWDDAPDGDVCAIGPNGSNISCMPYGADCGASPSCACIHPPSCSPTQIAKGCFERDGGVGFEIRCGAGT